MNSASRKLDAAAVFFALTFPSLLTWAYFQWLPVAAPTAQQPVYAIGKTIQFVFPVFWTLLIQRRRVRWSRPTAQGLVAGVLFGGVVFGAGIGVYHVGLRHMLSIQSAGAAIRAKLASFGVNDLTGFVALGAFYSLAHSFLEEYYWRWFVFGQLRESMSWMTAMGVSSVGFMAHHVILLGVYFGWASPWTYVFSLGVAVGGAYWAWLYHRTRSLLGPWLSHMLIDAAIFVTGYDLAWPWFRQERGNRAIVAGSLQVAYSWFADEPPHAA